MAHADKNLPEKKDTIRKPAHSLDVEGILFSEPLEDLENADFQSYIAPEDLDPSFDYEGFWDTVSVNPYKIDLSKKEDTTLIRLQDHLHCDYAHPFEGHVTSDFGPRGRRFHMGIDIDLETGDSVRCAFEGVVRIARRSSTYGNVVMVRHKNGLETIYAHLSRIDVEIGQRVDAGTLLGLGGNTGRSRGSHLHFEVRYKGMAIDPNLVINFNHCELRVSEIALTKDHFNYIKKTTPKKGKGHVYVVRKGDTLGKIARKTGTTVKRLCKVNGIRSTTILRPGRRLKIG